MFYGAMHLSFSGAILQGRKASPYDHDVNRYIRRGINSSRCGN